MDLPPPDARSSGALFDPRPTTHAIDARCGDVPPPPSNASEQPPQVSSTDDARLFGFESEMEASLTYIPIAVRFKLDKCGIKLSLAQWNQLPESVRRKLLKAPCANGSEISRYGQALRRLISEVIGDDPQLMQIAATPAWEDLQLPSQIAIKALQLGIRTPSSEQWRGLTALQRFALLKLSRASSDNRNLVPALREFGLL
jgi:hypothetical protein